MKSSDLIKQLSIQLPKHTTFFNDSIDILNIVFVPGLVTVTTSLAHGLVSGDLVSITGALSPNPITSLTQENGIATAITANDHDLTKDKVITGLINQANQYVNITGASDSLYNGNKKLLSVSNRRTFSFEVDRTASASAIGGVLNENLNFGYNGSFNITVTAPNEFTYSVSRILGSPASGTPLLNVKTRVSGSASLDKSILSYTKQNPNKYWAFVVLDETRASKDRFTNNDSDKTRSTGVDPRQKLIQNFSIYVYAPCKNEIAARAVRDSMEDVLIALFNSLLGFKPQTGLSEGAHDGITFVEHGIELYQESYYIHRFQFQNLVDITFNDTLQEESDVAFRDIHIDYLDPFVSDGDDIIMTSNIDLDEEPI